MKQAGKPSSQLTEEDDLLPSVITAGAVDGDEPDSQRSSAARGLPEHVSNCGDVSGNIVDVRELQTGASCTGCVCDVCVGVSEQQQRQRLAVKILLVYVLFCPSPERGNVCLHLCVEFNLWLSDWFKKKVLGLTAPRLLANGDLCKSGVRSYPSDRIVSDCIVFDRIVRFYQIGSDRDIIVL